MQHRWFASAVVAASLGFGGFAYAETLAVCGAEAGRAYYIEGGVVPKAKSGWTDDGISSGRTTLSRNTKGEYDITFSDATGGSYSSRNEGAVVIAQRLSPDEAAILVAYPAATIEIYQFTRDASGVPHLLHLQSKGGDLMTKAAIFEARCSVMTRTHDRLIHQPLDLLESLIGVTSIFGLPKRTRCGCDRVSVGSSQL